jgi:adenylate cyclase
MLMANSHWYRYRLPFRPFVLVAVLVALLQQVSTAQPVDDDNIDVNLYSVDQLLDQARRADSDVEKERLAKECIRMSLGSSRTESGIVQAHILLGEVYTRSGRIELALSNFIEAENRVVTSGTTQYLPMIYAGVGDLYFTQKLYDNAKNSYIKVLKINPRDYHTIEQLADSYLYGIMEATNRLQQYDIHNIIGTGNGAADSDVPDGSGKATKGKNLNEMRFDSAEFLYKILIAKYKEDGNNAHLIQIYQKIASAYEQQGNVGKQLFYYLRIEDIVSKFGKPHERGRLYNNLGKVYAAQGEYQKALENFEKTEIQCRFAAVEPNKPCDNEELLFTNIGVSMHNLGRTKEGIAYLFRALEILKARKDFTSMASLEHLIATVYFNIDDRYNALSHTESAITYAKAVNDIDILSRAYRTASRIYQDLYDFEKAFEYYNNYLELSDIRRLDEQRREMLLSERGNQLRAAESDIKYLIVQREIKEKALEATRLREQQLAKDNEILAAKARETELEVQVLQKQKEADGFALREKVALALQADQKLRTAARELEIQRQNSQIANIERDRERVESERLASEQKVALLNREKELSDLQLMANQEFQRNTYMFGALGGLVLLVMGLAWFFARRASRRLKMQNQKIEAQKNQIDVERGKSDRLLRNILPDEIAEELKTRGHAAPKLYESATVLFTDFVNFTKLSSNLQPERIISELDECFLAFDEIIEKHNLEKIKTIGDAFMCAGGLPVPNDTHPSDAVRAAIEINAWLQQRNKERPDAIFKEMRIGIHTGPVVAGVIGKNKFAYDIWGDAVNLASRLEEQGESGRINISSHTYEAIKGQFECSPRGQREVHNKGLVDMYFVEREKA